MNSYYIAAAIMVLSGLLLRAYIERRRFYRRGPAGLQHFKTYSGAVVTTFIEKIGIRIGSLLILIGLVAFLVGYNKSAKEKAAKKTPAIQRKK